MQKLPFLTAIFITLLIQCKKETTEEIKISSEPEQESQIKENQEEIDSLILMAFKKKNEFEKLVKKKLYLIPNKS